MKRHHHIKQNENWGKKAEQRFFSLFIKINDTFSQRTKEDYRVNLRERKDFISIHKSFFFPISRALLCHQSLNRIFHHVYFRLLCLFCIRFDLIKNPLINEFSATVPKKKKASRYYPKGSKLYSIYKSSAFIPSILFKICCSYK